MFSKGGYFSKKFSRFYDFCDVLIVRKFAVFIDVLKVQDVLSEGA